MSRFNESPSSFSNCCRNCVPPKRHLKCHATCQEYIDAKREHEKKQEYLRKIRQEEIKGRDYDKVAMNWGSKEKRSGFNK